MIKLIQLFVITIACLGFTAVEAGMPKAPPAPDAKVVNDAVKSGRDYLFTMQEPDGKFGGDYKEQIGNTALCIYALRKAGIPATDERLKKALTHIMTYAAGNMKADAKGTYNIGICLLALDSMVTHVSDISYAPPQDKPMLAAASKLAQQLMSMQGPRGGWFYTGKSDGDLSTTQHGGLGMWAAERMNIPVPRQLYDQLAAYVVKIHQDQDGSFTYRDQIKKAKYSYTMTAAGIGTLAICFRQIKKTEIVREVIVDDYEKGTKEKKIEKQVVMPGNKGNTDIEKAIEKGFKAMEAQGFVEKNAYWWYALERACTLTGTKQIGGHDWYATLCAQILPLQKPNGSWVNGHDATCDTCWAILALSKATSQMVNSDYEYDDPKGAKSKNAADAKNTADKGGAQSKAAANAANKTPAKVGAPNEVPPAKPGVKKPEDE